MRMSGRLSAFLMGLIVMLVGIGMFLWDWYGEYIHFIWIIPFFIAGPIVFISGLIIVFKSLFSGKESFKKTMPPKESTETVRPLPTLLSTLRLNVKRMENRKDVKGLIKALRDEDKYVGMMAAEALGRIGDARAIEPLVQALKDEDENLVKYAGNALYEIWFACSRSLRQEYNDDVKGLIKALRDEDKYVRMSAAGALGDIGDARAVEPLVQALKDEYWPARWAVAVALGLIGDARAVEPLVQALEDKAEYVRGTAAGALGEIGDARALQPLTRALNDEHEEVRKIAKEALQKMGFKETKPPKESKEKVSRYYNDKYGFSIEPPSGWTVDDSGRAFDKMRTELDKATIKQRERSAVVNFFEQLKRMTVVQFFGPGEEGITPTIGITVGDRLGTETLDEWVSRLKQGSISVPDLDFQLLSEGTRVVGGIDAYEEVHTCRSLLYYYPVYDKQKQVVLLKDNKVYMIVYTSSPTYFDKHLHVFDASVQTFKFKSRAIEVPPPSSTPSARAPEMFDLREWKCSTCGSKLHRTKKKPYRFYCPVCGLETTAVREVGK